MTGPSATSSRCDIALVGGGLAGGLIALALRRLRPGLDVQLFEAGARLGGNHRWSWFATDLTVEGEALLAPFRKTSWDSGYEVRFPAHQRVLGAGYRSLASEDFDAGLRRELAPGTIRTATRVAAIEPGRVTLEDGSAIAAATVIDCRDGIDAGHLTGGWQVFLGRQFRLAEPHGLTRPIIMDATVEQLGGYRFVYVLPLGAHDLFLEDTYYNDSPELDGHALSQRIDAYAAAHGWAGRETGRETGVLPVITGGDFGAFQAAHRIAGVAMAGARGGFVHPLTSYTVPFAVATALAVAADAGAGGPALAERLEARARRHWRATGFYRMLGKMLFGAAQPERRYRVFEHFYGLPERLIERFYAGRSTLADRVPTLVGKPPVPISRALRALAGSQPSLARITSRTEVREP